jgi:hypothetical protein
MLFLRGEEFSSLRMDKPNLKDVNPNVHLTYIVSSPDGLTYMTRSNPIHCRLEDLSFLNVVKCLAGIVVRGLPGITRKPIITQGDPAYPIRIFRVGR